MNVMHWCQAYARWWKAWRALPVRSWVIAANLYRDGRYEEAARFYQRGLRGHPRHPARISARLDLGYCLFKAGAFEDAAVILKEAVTLAPQHREAYLRLASLQMWRGEPIEAAWTLRRAIRHLGHDGEIGGLFLLALLENGGPRHLITEALEEIKELKSKSLDHNKLKIAEAKFEATQGDKSQGKLALEILALDQGASRDAVLAYAELLFEEGNVAYARQQLRRLISNFPEYPRVFSLLAQVYLKSGTFYNPQYSVQLATTACQKTGWGSVREIHVLAEAYYHSGDKNAALLAASRAREVGAKNKVSYRDIANLDELIENLSTGTLA